MTVHARPEYQIRPRSGPPPGYPTESKADRFQSAPDGLSFEERRAGYIAWVLSNPSPANTKPVWYELVRMAGGGQPHLGVIESALDFIDARKDCADFVLHGILRMLYQFCAEPGCPIPDGLRERARRTVLGFKYFPDEPGIDSLCTWTENHYILFSSAAYLAGQLYPGETFPNSGETGEQKMQVNRDRILRWLDLRFRTGFSEWLSHVYYDEDLTALLALVDFARDEEIRARAETVIGLLLLDIALNSYRGVFGSSHGRAYENTKQQAAHEGTTDAFKLLFGMGIYSGFDNMSAPAFALSRYRVPPAITAVAQDTSISFINRQRMGIRLAELERWGIRPDSFEDGMHCLTLEAYLHPRTIANTLRMMDLCRWWDNSFLNAFKPYRGLLKTLGALGGLPLLARLLERDICRNTREEVNLYTYKTPDGMLSTAQDYRKGFGGDQQHIWQATLAPDAVCFTTHPARIEGVTPNYWAGSGLLPRAAQYRDVTVAVYKLEKIPALYVPIRHFFTHAWLPKEKFAEVVEQDGWIFARKGGGYLALRSQAPYRWGTYRTPAGDPNGSAVLLDSDTEIVAEGAENIWICQLGRAADDGPFGQFIQTICAAPLTFDGLSVRYQSPGNGLVEFGWEGPLTVDGTPVRLGDYPRYDNPFVSAAFDPAEVRVSAGPHEWIARRDGG